MTPDQIPDEVVEAAERVLCQVEWKNNTEDWNEIYDRDPAYWRDQARAAIAAALAAWPRATTERRWWNDNTIPDDALILPLGETK